MRKEYMYTISIFSPKSFTILQEVFRYRFILLILYYVQHNYVNISKNKMKHLV